MIFQRDCPSGQLTRKKFLEVYSGFFPDGNAEKFCEHVFRTFDADHSELIDFKEFLLAINITSAGKPEEKLEWAFQMYDINADGTIEKKEMVEIISVSFLFIPYLIARIHIGSFSHNLNIKSVNQPAKRQIPGLIPSVYLCNIRIFYVQVLTFVNRAKM